MLPQPTASSDTTPPESPENDIMSDTHCSPPNSPSKAYVKVKTEKLADDLGGLADSDFSFHPGSSTTIKKEASTASERRAFRTAKLRAQKKKRESSLAAAAEGSPSSVVADGAEAEDPEEDGLSKREKRKIENRKSAAKSRKRKHDHMLWLERQVKALKETNQDLSSRLSKYEVVASPQQSFLDMDADMEDEGDMPIYRSLSLMKLGDNISAEKVPARCTGAATGQKQLTERVAPKTKILLSSLFLFVVMLGLIATSDFNALHTQLCDATNFE